MRRCLIVVIASLVLACGTPLSAGPVHSQIFSISVPQLRLATGERVVGFEIHVQSGRIAGLPKTPIGWNISVDNKASWTATVSANSTVGAAALDVGFFRKFLLVEKNTSLGLPFLIYGEVVVTKDFVTTRRIKLRMSDFARD